MSKVDTNSGHYNAHPMISDPLFRFIILGKNVPQDLSCGTSYFSLSKNRQKRQIEAKGLFEPLKVHFVHANGLRR